VNSSRRSSEEDERKRKRKREKERERKKRKEEERRREATGRLNEGHQEYLIFIKKRKQVGGGLHGETAVG
jgi:hypothetical protein